MTTNNNFDSPKAASRFPVRALTLVVLTLTLSVSVFGDVKKTRHQAQKALRAGDFARAEELYREVLKIDEQDNNARLGLSEALLKQRRLQDAFDMAARVVASEPLSARAHALLGSAMLATGEFRLSIQEFRTALALDDNNAMAIAGLAMVDFYENRTLEALNKLRHAVDIDPNEPDFLFGLAQAAARSERYKEAADAYELFLVISPRTDSDRRARIRGMIDFLKYLGHQSALYSVSGSDRSVLTFESVDNRPILRLHMNGSKQTFRFVLDTGSGMSVVSEETARKLGLRPVEHEVREGRDAVHRRDGTRAAQRRIPRVGTEGDGDGAGVLAGFLLHGDRGGAPAAIGAESSRPAVEAPPGGTERAGYGRLANELVR